MGRAVAGRDVEVAVGVCSRPGVAQPDAGFASVGRDIQDSSLRQGLRIIGHHPTVVRIDVAGRSPFEIKDAVCKRERGPRIFFQRIESHLPVGSSGTLARHCGRDEFGPAELFDSGGDGEGVQVLEIFVGADGVFDPGPSST